MAFALKLIILVLPIYCFASSKDNLTYYKKRQAAFHDWLEAEEKRKMAVDAGRSEIRKKRERYEEKMAQVRSQFKRVERSNRHLEADYLKKLEARERENVKIQERYAKNQKQVEEFQEKYVVPMKPQEYRLEETGD